MIETVQGCPSLEEVAAFAEGRLSGAERERVIAHLAGCADCRELLAGTIETLDDLGVTAGEQTAAPARVASFPRRRWAPLVALAAAAVLVVSVVVVQRIGGTAQPPTREAWIASLPPAPSLVPNLWGGIVMRGAGDERPLTAAAAELGALLFDVEVAAKGGDAARADEMLRRMAVLTEQAGVLERETATLRSLAAAPAADLARRLAGELPGVESSLRDRFPPFYLDLGAFAEAARVAGLAGHRGPLDQRAGRRYVEWLLKQEEESLAPEIRRELETLARPSTTAAEQQQSADALLREVTR
jgi:putative zinc finger protein